MSRQLCGGLSLRQLLNACVILLPGGEMQYWEIYNQPIHSLLSSDISLTPCLYSGNIPELKVSCKLQSILL